MKPNVFYGPHAWLVSQFDTHPVYKPAYFVTCRCGWQSPPFRGRRLAVAAGVAHTHGKRAK
jgi:hypothetical protein